MLSVSMNMVVGQLAHKNETYENIAVVKSDLMTNTFRTS